MEEGSWGGRVARKGDIKRLSRVKTVGLRNFLVEKVDLLKPDIEGAETEVLRDCEDKLSNVENIFIEYHSFLNEPQSLPEILSILQRSGFRFYIESVGALGYQPFIERPSDGIMDLQLNIYAFRM